MGHIRKFIPHIIQYGFLTGILGDLLIEVTHIHLKTKLAGAAQCRQLSGQCLEERGFSGSIGTDHSQLLSPVHGKGHLR